MWIRTLVRLAKQPRDMSVICNERETTLWFFSSINSRQRLFGMQYHTGTYVHVPNVRTYVRTQDQCGQTQYSKLGDPPYNSFTTQCMISFFLLFVAVSPSFPLVIEYFSLFSIYVLLAVYLLGVVIFLSCFSMKSMKAQTTKLISSFARSRSRWMHLVSNSQIFILRGFGSSYLA